MFVKKHKHDIKKPPPTDHHSEIGHYFNLNSVSILDNEQNYKIIIFLDIQRQYTLKGLYNT